MDKKSCILILICVLLPTALVHAQANQSSSSPASSSKLDPSGITKTFDDLLEDTKSLQDRLDYLRNTLENLHKKYRDLRTSLLTPDQISVIELNKGRIKTTNFQLQIEEANLETAKKSLQSDIDNSRSENSTSKGKQTSDKETKEGLQSKIKGLTTQIQEVTTRQINMQKEIASNNSLLSDYDTVMNKNLKSYNDLEDLLTQISDTESSVRDIFAKLALDKELSTKEYYFRFFAAAFYTGIIILSTWFFMRSNQNNVLVRQLLEQGPIRAISIFLILCTITLFGIFHIFRSQDLSPILGGIIGYLLGQSSPGAQNTGTRK